jgi:hypothetical protein
MKIVLGTVFGLIASFATNYIVLLLFMRMDASADLNDPEALAEFIKGFTTFDYMVPIAAHLFGVLAGLLTARAICKTSALPLVIVMTFHMAATVLNLFAIPHPVWFAIVDIVGPMLIFIPFIKTQKQP